MPPSGPAITKRIEWLRPYYERARRHIPRGKRVTRIMALRAARGRNMHFYGQISTSDDRNYHISLYTHYWSHTWWPASERRRVRKPFGRMDILQHLAHEIAHMAHWRHTPAQKRLENRIANEFMAMLEREGYTSEEDELGGRGPAEPDVRRRRRQR